MSGPLTHPPAQVVGRLLVDLAIGTDTAGADWRVFYDGEPDSPDEVITVYDTANVLQGGAMIGLTLEHFGIQIRVRAGTYPLGWAIINSLRGQLDSVNRSIVTVAGTSYNVHGFNRTSGPFHLGTESPTSKRDIFTINFTVSIKKLP